MALLLLRCLNSGVWALMELNKSPLDNFSVFLPPLPGNSIRKEGQEAVSHSGEALVQQPQPQSSFSQRKQNLLRALREISILPSQEER